MNIITSLGGVFIPGAMKRSLSMVINSEILLAGGWSGSDEGR